jgi:hypothetical protein
MHSDLHFEPFVSFLTPPNRLRVDGKAYALTLP